MSCSPSSLAKYKSRPGPPIPATLCKLGEIKLGNDGNKYQIVEVNSRSGLTLKWQKCGTGSTNCKLVKSKKPLQVNKTANYTIQLKLTLSQYSMAPSASKSKTFLNSKIKSIMTSLLDTHNQDDLIININDGDDATILYTFHYTKNHLDKNRIYYNEDVRDNNGNLELDEDDFIRNIYEDKLVNGQLKGLKTHKNWFINNYWDDIKLIDNFSPSLKTKSKKVTTKVKSTKKTSVKSKKQTTSEALKLRNEVYKIWDKVAKKSKKRYDDEEYLIAHPDGLVWGYGTDAKYFDWEFCVAKDRPKRECNKIVTMLKQDLSKMNKALDKVNKYTKTPVKPKKTPVKTKKTPVKTNIKNDLKKAKELNDKIYKTWNKISKISKKLYNNKNHIEFHPDYDGLGGWSYPTNNKYSDLKKCISNSAPKRECNKITKLLKTDLSWMERTLNRSIKLQDKMLKTKKLSVTKKTKKKCKSGKVVNPKTGRCINQLKKIDKLLTKANSKLSKVMSSK